MPALEDLYREIILDHYRTPRNRGELDPPAIKAEGHNPLCGDDITIYLSMSGEGDDAIIEDIKVGGQGCSISQSSASMMSQSIKGKTVAENRALARRFKSLMGIAGAEPHDGDDAIDLGDLEALEGVMKFPVRIKCAVLSWNTFLQALDTGGGTTSTE
ncbi:MAG: nitrogen fixation NifU-like protein [Ilumatobacter sp.]|jgi:nitrogen fixation NifU-like protein